ncbi:MAG: PspC domain-containing protein [Syntrophomonadaceae bacterium]|nr:PspC domain-containing protein [Syntrophomonadaceae bacterium]
MEQLRRSKHNRMIAGVAGGMAEFFDLDVALVRLIWVLFIFAGGVGFFAYIVCCIVIPEATEAGSDKLPEENKEPTDQDFIRHRRERRRRNAGFLLIGLGLVFLAQNIVPWHVWAKSWPLLLVVAGLYILFRDHSGDRI